MTEKVRIPSSGGKILAAIIHYPQERTERLAILCPGYLDTKDYPHLVALAEVLREHGYTIVRFDPMGTWESEGNISDYTTTQYLKDIGFVLDYMLKKGAYKHILLGGHSKGGFISMLFAAEAPRISIVLAIMSPYSLIKTIDDEKLKEWEKNGFRISKRNIPGGVEEREFRVPYSHPADAQKYNVLNEIDKLRVPLILIAGELDDTVPAADIKLIFDRANEPKRFAIVKNVGHDYRNNSEDIKRVNEVILNFLSKFQ